MSSTQTKPLKKRSLKEHLKSGSKQKYQDGGPLNYTGMGIDFMNRLAAENEANLKAMMNDPIIGKAVIRTMMVNKNSPGTLGENVNFSGFTKVPNPEDPRVQQIARYVGEVLPRNNLRLLLNTPKKEMLSNLKNFETEKLGKQVVGGIKAARNLKSLKKEGYIPEYEYGGYMMLPEYGFGSWLKENVAGFLKGSKLLTGVIPGIGSIVGPVLDIAGAVVANKSNKAEAARQQKIIDEKKAADEKERMFMENSILSQNLFRNSKDINYGETFEYGGELTTDPQIVEYSKKADLHSEGIGGVPVDKSGNPVVVSKAPVVGLTEGGEVTWNGYVFSNKLKIKT